MVGPSLSVPQRRRGFGILGAEIVLRMLVVVGVVIESLDVLGGVRDPVLVKAFEAQTIQPLR